MKKKNFKILILILGVILVGEMLFVGIMFASGKGEILLNQETEPSTPAATESTPATEPVTQTTVPLTTEAPTEPTEPEPTEPQEQHYMLTFAGDCTLGSMPSWFGYKSSFIKVIGENYDYPFANVAEYFKNDDFTIVNLEGVFADSGSAQSKRFTFRGPTAYTNILTGSSVEAVTLANNHSMDFGNTGYKSTKDALDAAGVAYVEENKTQLYTTESGLVIGLYADSFTFSKSAIQKNVKALKEAGAEVIICAFHWGVEGSYRANASQRSYAQAALDAGAHIVYGHHPHVLQKVVQKENAVVYYSLGNFSFGGHGNPRDKDSAVLQQEIIRGVDGKIRLGELKMIPVCISSKSNTNNFQPTPYEEGTKAYERTMQKLLGTFTGPDLIVDYSSGSSSETTAPTDSTEGADPTEPTGGTSPTEPPKETQPQEPPKETQPQEPPKETQPQEPAKQTQPADPPKTDSTPAE